MEIEFRGRCYTSGRWIFGHYVKHKARQPCPVDDDYGPDNILHYIFISEHADWNMPRQLKGIKVHPETISQYTGLKDRSDRKIFAGDFIMRRNTESTGIENEITYLVAFENGAFVMKRKDSYYPYRFDYEGYSLHKDHSMLQQFNEEAPWTNGSYEVIGNIHDNPELLEGKA